MKTQLIETLKEKWTKKSTKIACASVGTVAVLGVVGALIACNLPHTEQVIAEDGTITTVQTQQKESHGLFDIFHAPTEQADAAQNTTTEMTPPQTNADGTPINASAAAPGTPQAAASGDTTSNPAVTSVQTQTSSDTPVPAPSPASEDASAPAPAPQEMPRTNVHGGVYMPNINCYKVIDVQPVDGVDPKGFLRDYYLVGGKRYEANQEAEACDYGMAHKVSISVQTEKVYTDKGVMPKAGKYHLETLDGKRISPYITIAPGGSYNQNFTYKN